MKMNYKNITYILTPVLFILLASCNDQNKSSENDELKNSAAQNQVTSIDTTKINDPKKPTENKELKEAIPEKKNNDVVNIVRDPQRKDVANVFWKRKYTLFDLNTDEPIFPVIINGQKIYKIYYSSNEDPNPYQGSFTETQLENHLYYKFKNKTSCMEFCNSRQ